MGHLDHARRKIVVDPGVFDTPWMLRKLLKVFFGFFNQSKLKHEHSMIKSAKEMIRIDQQPSLQLLNCTQEVARKWFFGRINEVKVWGFALGQGCLWQWHNP